MPARSSTGPSRRLNEEMLAWIHSSRLATWASGRPDERSQTRRLLDELLRLGRDLLRSRSRARDGWPSRCGSRLCRATRRGDLLGHVPCDGLRGRRHLQHRRAPAPVRCGQCSVLCTLGGTAGLRPLPVLVVDGSRDAESAARLGPGPGTGRRRAFGSRSRIRTTCTHGAHSSRCRAIWSRRSGVSSPSRKWYTRCIASRQSTFVSSFSPFIPAPSECQRYRAATRPRATPKSCNAFSSALLPRWSRLMTVPIGTSMMSAISL